MNKSIQLHLVVDQKTAQELKQEAFENNTTVTSILLSNLQLHQQKIKEARKKGTHTNQEWINLLNKFNRCVKCNKTGVKLEKNHIIPIYQGGSDSIDNIQPLCKKCNCQKGMET